MNPTLCSLPTLPPLTFELTHTLYTLERISASSSSVAEIEPELVRPQRHGRDRHLSPTLLSVFFLISLEILALTPHLLCVLAARGGHRRWNSVRAVAESVAVHASSWELACASMAPGPDRLELLCVSAISPPSQTSPR
jgi:hypothetical protein